MLKVCCSQLFSECEVDHTIYSSEIGKPIQLEEEWRQQINYICTCSPSSSNKEKGSNNTKRPTTKASWQVPESLSWSLCWEMQGSVTCHPGPFDCVALLCGSPPLHLLWQADPAPTSHLPAPHQWILNILLDQLTAYQRPHRLCYNPNANLRRCICARIFSF